METLICFGDSITARREGFRTPRLTSKLDEQLSDWEVINAGVSGDNTRDALRRLDADVLAYNPDLVTVFFGANDAAFHKMIGLEEYETNLLEIIRKISATKIILITPAPVDEHLQQARSNEVLEQYAKAAVDVSNAMNTRLIDLYTNMIALDTYTDMLKGQRNDGLHFGELGYEFLLRLITEKVKLIKGRI